MAELKRTFIKGGMNLDLDERLVGQGLYREAINIRVSSSSEGNEGSLETVRANTKVIAQDRWRHQGDGELNTFGPRRVGFTQPRVVGTAVDRTNDYAYHFVKDSAYVNAFRLEGEGFGERARFTINFNNYVGISPLYDYAVARRYGLHNENIESNEPGWINEGPVGPSDFGSQLSSNWWEAAIGNPDYQIDGSGPWDAGTIGGCPQMRFTLNNATSSGFSQITIVYGAFTTEAQANPLFPYSYTNISFPNGHIFDEAGELVTINVASAASAEGKATNFYNALSSIGVNVELDGSSVTIIQPTAGEDGNLIELTGPNRGTVDQALITAIPGTWNHLTDNLTGEHDPFTHIDQFREDTRQFFSGGIDAIEDLDPESFGARGIVVRADAIYEYEPNRAMQRISEENNGHGDMDLVFNDVYEIRTPAVFIGQPMNELGTYIQLPDDGLNMRDLDIREDMRILQYDTIVGTDFAVSNSLTEGAGINTLIDAFYVDYVDRVNYRVYIKDDFNRFADNVVIPDDIALDEDNFFFAFVSKRILDFDYSRYITGINVFDGLIFFTDNKNEPKKIQINRSKVGTLSDQQSVYPDWLTDRRLFHTRLLRENSDNNLGFQGVPGWQFNGYHDNAVIANNAINTGLGGTIESHCTVIRPNPEEHLKVLTDVGAVVGDSDVKTVGPTKGVMTHPFPIHPNHASGKTLQFAVAFLNEAGFYNEAGGLITNDGLGEPLVGLGPDTYYNFRSFIPYADVNGNQAMDFRNSMTLDIPDTLSWGAYVKASRGSIYGTAAPGTGALDPMGAGNGFFGVPANIFNQDDPRGYTIESLVFPTAIAENVQANSQPSAPYPLFKNYLNAGMDSYQELGPLFGFFNDPTDGHIIPVGPMRMASGITEDDGVFNQALEPFYWENYSGAGGTRGVGANSVNENVLVSFSPGSSFGGNAGSEGDVIHYTNQMPGGYLLDGDVAPPIYANQHGIAKAYHLGGLFSQANISGPSQNLAAISEYWGLGGDPDDGPMADFVHNGRIDLNGNNLYRPTGPGRFVVQPHGFSVGDKIVLEGQGNTRRSNAVGRYTDVYYTDEDDNSFFTPASVLEETGGFVDEDLWTIDNQGGQDFGDTQELSFNSPANPLGANFLNSTRFAGRRHDGFADLVKATITKIEHVNMRPEGPAGAGAVINGVPNNVGFTDNLGNVYTDLKDKFIFLNDGLVDQTIIDGTDPGGEEIVLDDGTVVDLPPSFFSTEHFISQYIITIQIDENNAKDPLDPSLRVDLSNKYVRPGDEGPIIIGEGDSTKNAAMLPKDYKGRRSPYWTTNQNWGRDGLLVDSQGNPKFYGPPLPQVWSVSLASQYEGSSAGRLADEKSLREAMLRFSYRYQYEDNEYSGFAPFTTVIWRTLNQKIDWPNYYISLINEIKDLRLIDWTPKNLPHDVKAVELVVKSEEANNIYAVKKYDFRDGEYNLPANGSYTGLHPFNANTLGLTIDPNQILRPFDSVPKSAKAQEVTANRVVYGNYLKDYNLVETVLDFNNEIISSSDIKVNLEVGLYTYVNQEINEILGPDGNPIIIGASSDDGAIEVFEEAFAGTNPNFGVPQESIKSYRSYQVGIVYRDEFGRETPVLTNRQAIIKVSPEDSKKTQRISVIVKNPHPTWAKSYKFFVKDTSLDYNVLPLEEIRHFINVDGEDDASVEAQASSLTEKTNSVLIFSSDHRNKVQEGDILIQKRAHRKSGQPDPDLSNVTNNYESDNLNLEYEVQRIRNEVPEALIDALDDDPNVFEGKFFVYVKTDRPLVVNNDVGPLPGPNTAKTQGVFETLPKPNYDTDLYYEASQAYPIVLDDETDEQFIKVGRMVEAYYYTALIPGPGGALGLNSVVQVGDTTFPLLYTSDNDGDGGVSILDDIDLTPITVTSVSTNVGRHNINDALYTTITLSQPVTITVPANPDQLVLKIQEHRGGRLNVGEHVYVTVAESVVNSDTILVKRHTHLSNFSLVNDVVTPIALPYYNCFCFGNGIEISTVKNSFNGARIQKGVKASSIYEDYAESKVGEGLIFSGIYNSYSGFNETNQFIEALGITKRFNPDHGFIQKLYSRANDLIVLCEDKVLKVLSQKDAIFKADGNPDLLATDKVLGQSVAFDGEYGISNNPESFAQYGFRSYFTDAKRGVVIRLSKDGMTIISDQGMDSYFKNQLSDARDQNSYIFGSYDIDKNEYLLSCRNFDLTDIEDEIFGYLTIAWDESLNAWTSFRTYYKDAQGYSLKNQYFSISSEHYHHDNVVAKYGFYEGYFQSEPSSQEPRIALVYNEMPGTVKDFTYTNYEGTQARIISNNNDGVLSTNLNKDGWWISRITTDLEQGMSINFKNKENKWHNNLMHVNIDDKQGDTLSTDSEDFQKYIAPLGIPTSIVENSDGSLGFTISFDLGIINMAVIQEGVNVRVMRTTVGDNPTVIPPSETVGQFVNLGSVVSFDSTSITTNVSTPELFEALGPIVDDYNVDISSILLVLTQNPVEHSGVKGYYARCVWRNNDFENKSELFAAALNAVESSK